MGSFRAFVAKEFRHILRDRWTCLLLIGLPVLMLILFGFALNTEVKGTPLAILDPAPCGLTRQLSERLLSSDYFTRAPPLSREAELDGAFRRGEAGLVVAFSERFCEDLLHSGNAQVALIADGSDPNTARTLTGYAASILLQWQQEHLAAGATAVPYQIAPTVRLLYNPSMKGAFHFVPGVMGMILMLICTLMTSVSIAREKEQGTMEVLLVSPMRPIKMLLAKATPYLVLSALDLAIILLLSVHVLEVPIAGSLFWLVALSFVFIFLSLSLGLLISSMAASQVAALLISGMAMMMPVIMLSGMMFPIENMPRALQVVSNAVPARWYVAAVKKLMIQGLGVEAIVQELIILGGMAALCMALCLALHRERLE